MLNTGKNEYLRQQALGEAVYGELQATITTGAFRERAGYFLEMTKRPHSQEPTLGDYFTFQIQRRR